MSWRRCLLSGWLLVSVVWVVFAFYEYLAFVAAEPGESAWSAADILDSLAILLGFPLAFLGAGIAVMWILRGTQK